MQAEKVSPDGASTVLRVLVAEDDDAMRQLIVGRLRREGHLVDEVEDGFELADYVEVCAAGQLRFPDVLVSDIRMPGHQGTDVLERLTRLSPFTAVMMLSAFCDTETKADALRRGADVVLEKPVELDDVAAIVAELAAARESA